MTTPELNNLLDELEYSQDYQPIPQEEDYEDDLTYLLPSDFKQVDLRSASLPVKQPPHNQVQPTTAARSSAAAAATAMLPAYCDPPNPCPPGYSTSDGCIEEFENSSEFSRNYQSTQNCICDTEHMFNCPAPSGNSPRATANTVSSISTQQLHLALKSFLCRTFCLSCLV